MALAYVLKKLSTALAREGRFHLPPSPSLNRVKSYMNILLLLHLNLIFKVQKVPPPSDGWEYARTLHEGFHLDKKSTDYLRRRRWLHKIKTLPDERTKEGGKKFPIFKVMVQGTKVRDNLLNDICCCLTVQAYHPLFVWWTLTFNDCSRLPN